MADRPGMQKGAWGAYKVAKYHYEIRHMPSGQVVDWHDTWQKVLDIFNLSQTALDNLYSHKLDPAMLGAFETLGFSWSRLAGQVWDEMLNPSRVVILTWPKVALYLVVAYVLGVVLGSGTCREEPRDTLRSVDVGRFDGSFGPIYVADSRTALLIANNYITGNGKDQPTMNDYDLAFDRYLEKSGYVLPANLSYDVAAAQALPQEDCN